MKGQTEIWRKHPEYTEIEVSTMGRVRTVKGHYYKISHNNSGYLQVEFRVNGKRIHKYVHRIVVETFIPNPDNLPQVNHKDNDRTNNNVDNLEWCTREYNIAYREKYGTPAKDFVPKSPVYAVNLKTQETLWFESQHEASRVLGLQQPNINAVIKGRIKQTGGYQFENADDE